MRLIQQCIEKNFELYSEFMIKGMYIRAFWYFLNSLTISISYLGISYNYKEINELWIRFLINPYQKIDSYILSKLQLVYSRDQSLINQALDKIRIHAEEESNLGYDIWREGKLMIGVLSYEYPEENTY